MAIERKNKDIEFMKVAINEAMKGVGKVNPNPLVGAVVVIEEQIIGKGYHEFYGGPHAEVNAIENAKNNLIAQGKSNSLEDATIYVTLEPCSHFDKTPPCADLIIKNNIKRCVVGCIDPNPKVSGNGIKMIQDAGIDVQTGVLDSQCREINKIFFKYIKEQIPYIFLKCAITLDGKIATKNGSSKWITNSKAREKVQYYRDKFMGIMVGKNTVINDNPQLKTALECGRNPYRIIFDSKLEIPEDYKIISENSDFKTIIITSNENKWDGNSLNLEKKEKYNRLNIEYGIKFITFKGDRFNMKEILVELGKLGIDAILVEGGENIISQFFKEELIDAGEIFIAPKILGDKEGISFIGGFSKEKISQCIELKNVKYNIYGDNIGVEFDFNRGEGCLLD